MPLIHMCLWVFLFDLIQINLIQFVAMKLRLSSPLPFSFEVLNGFGAHVHPLPPLRGLQGFFHGSLWGFGLSWGTPFLGFLRGFVGLAHMVFYRIFWPRSSCFQFIGISSRFCDFWLGLPFGAGSLVDRLQSAFVLVNPRDPHFPGSTNQCSAWVGVSPLFGPWPLCLDDGISSDFPSCLHNGWRGS